MEATPYLRVDRALLEANVAHAAATAAAAGYALRPHAKTHKCPEIGRLQREAGAVGLTVATLGEAEVFAAAGLGELFVAYPLWLDADRERRLRGLLAAGASIMVGCDSAEAADRLARVAGLPVLIEVDSGHHRSGAAPDRAGELGAHAAARGLDVRGAFTFPGHSYGPEARRAAAADEAAALATAGAALAGAGVAAGIRSGGSTPSLAFADAAVLTEARPGVYVFGDAQQWELGACAPADIALACVATVVSAGPQGIIVDAGSKALGADRQPWSTGYGRVLDEPDARVVALSEHHATITWPGRRPRLGEQLRLVPNHVCAAVNLADRLCVVGPGGRTASWPVAARGRNA